MFTIDDSTRLMWFNGHSLEANLQFELVGIVRSRRARLRPRLTLYVVRMNSC